jgi:Mrp family chromosome partitioning ATPase
VAAQLLEACRKASVALGGTALPGLGVTSAVGGEGRSTIALTMAILQQQDYGRKVLLLEMDLEKPAMAELLGLSASPGLCELMREEAVLEQVIQPLEGEMAVITAGDPSGHAPRIMAEVLARRMLDELAAEFDIVVADLPPLLGCSYGLAAAEAVPRLLLVVRSGVTPIQRVREASGALGAPPVVLLNGTRTNLPRWLTRLIGF